MTDKVAQMTTDELRDLIGEVVEQKLLELVGDPDAGLELNPDLVARLKQQRQAVANGERGESLEEVAKRLGLD